MMTKEVLTAKYNQEIKMYERFIEAMSSVILALRDKNCDGKVVNARISNTVQKTLKEQGMTDVYVSIVPQYKVRYMKIMLPNDIRWFKAENGKSGYVDHNSYVEVELKYKHDSSFNERLVLNDTQEKFKTEMQRYIDKIKELQDYIAKYDEYQKENEKFKRLVKEYEDKIPYRMRYSVHLHDHTY